MLKAPQASVLPLHHSHHEFIFFLLVMVKQEVAIMAQPNQVVQAVIFTVSIEMMYSQHSRIVYFTPPANLLDTASN